MSSDYQLGVTIGSRYPDVQSLFAEFRHPGSAIQVPSPPPSEGDGRDESYYGSESPEQAPHDERHECTEVAIGEKWHDQSQSLNEDVTRSRKIDSKWWRNISKFDALCSVMMAMAVLCIVSAAIFVVLFIREMQIGESLLRPSGDTIEISDDIQALTDMERNPVLYGINYEVSNEISECTATQAEIARDLALLSRWTRRVRLVDTRCDALSMTLRAIQSMELDMEVIVAVDMTQNMDLALVYIQEALLRENSNGLIRAVMLTGYPFSFSDIDEDEIVGAIDRIKAIVTMTTSNDILVGMEETGSAWANLKSVANKLDVIGANVNPYYGGLSASESTVWTYDFLRKYVVSETRSNTTRLSFMLPEIGWPTAGPSIGEAEPGPEELQHFIDSWVCRNQGTQVGWYWQAGFDSDTDETKWGLYTADRQLKNITLPICA